MKKRIDPEGRSPPGEEIGQELEPGPATDDLNARAAHEDPPPEDSRAEGNTAQPMPGKKRAPTGHGSKFDRKLDEAVIAVLTQRTIEEAARSAGISPATLHRWRNEPEFQARYQETIRAVNAHAIDRARYLSDAVVSTEAKIMLTSSSDACRLRAAAMLWAIGEKATEREQRRTERSQQRAIRGDVGTVNLAERIIAARKRMRAELGDKASIEPVAGEPEDLQE